MTGSIMTIDEDGSKFWKNEKNQLHRTDGPAVEKANGSKEWYVNGKRHRTDGPAREWTDGSKEWWINGSLHRTDGPAIEYASGIKEWWIHGKFLTEESFQETLKEEIMTESIMTVDDNGTRYWKNKKGELHRTDGPAREWNDGSKEWYLNGEFHRTDGPAREYASGYKSWYLNGKLHRTDGPALEWNNGDKEWCLNGERHRTDGPAVENASGTKEWWIHGKYYSDEESFQKALKEKTRTDSIMTTDEKGNKYWRNEKGQYHRTDGPAVEWTDGSKEWYLYGELHRTDGPAREFASGYKSWHLNGQLHRTDGPAVENADGSRAWYLNGERYRTDGPAIENEDGSKSWYVNGSLHRTDGPAIEGSDGSKFWYLNGEKILSSFYREDEIIPILLKEMSKNSIYSKNQEIINKIHDMFTETFSDFFEIKKNEDLFSVSCQAGNLGEFNSEQLKELREKITREVLTSD